MLPDAFGCDLALYKEKLIDLVLSPPHCASPIYYVGLFNALSLSFALTVSLSLSLPAALLSHGKTKVYVGLSV